jgi:hypothetical protein
MLISNRWITTWRKPSVKKLLKDLNSRGKTLVEVFTEELQMPAAPKPIAHQPVKSSAIASMGHDAPGRILEVTYHNGGTYRYAGVSPSEHLSILAAPSKGKALNSLLQRRGLTGVRQDPPSIK